MDTLTTRMAAFKDRMLNLAKGKHSGYNTLDTDSNLGQPLVDGHEDDAGATPLGGNVTRPSPQGASSYMGGFINDPSYQLRETALLAKEAAAILWEMIALGEAGTARDDMVSQAKQLQAELRGAISDAPDVEASAMTEALESFDMLARCLSELGLGPPVEEPAPAPAAAQPVAEKPLIEL